MSGEGRSRLAFALSYFTLFAIYGVASPYLQLLLRGLGYGPAVMGLFLGFFEVIGIAGPFPMTRLTDAMGRFKPTLFACAFLVCAPLAPLVLLRGPAATCLCLAVLSLGLRSMVPIMDTATISLSSTRAGWDYGKLRATGSAGFVAIALILQTIPGFDQSPPERIVLWIGGSAAFFALSLLFLPEAGKAKAQSVANAKADAGASSPQVRRPFLSSGFVLGLVVIALGRLAMGPVYSFFSLYLVEEVKWNAVGGMWALSATAEIPLMFLSGRIVSRLGPMRATMLGTAAIAVRLAIYALFPSPAGVVAAQLLHSLCFGLLHPAGVAFVALMVSPERRAQGMAVYMSLGVALPAFLGSTLGGFVLQSWGYRVLFGSFIAFALAAIILYSVKRKSIAAAC
jgi:MFS transporter, PPP family, 3-phenylpropionic acid transporter